MTDDSRTNSSASHNKAADYEMKQITNCCSCTFVTCVFPFNKKLDTAKKSTYYFETPHVT